MAAIPVVRCFFQPSDWDERRLESRLENVLLASSSWKTREDRCARAVSPESSPLLTNATVDWVSKSECVFLYTVVRMFVGSTCGSIHISVKKKVLKIPG
eukprot:scaffold23649_cov26-Tisochrysis_lutea.AAC.1